MNGQQPLAFAELVDEYRGKDPDEQEYLLALALDKARDDEQIPDLGAKDFWLRAKDSLVRRILEQRVAVQAVVGTAVQQVYGWSTSHDVDSLVYRVPLAILTAMVTDAVLDAIRAGRSGGGDDSAGASGS